MNDLHCHRCHQGLDRQVMKKLTQFECGVVTCPKCHHQQTRYITEFDLMLHFEIMIFLYGGAVACISLLLNILAQTYPLVTLTTILIIFIGIYFLTKYISVWIYHVAPFKKTWANQHVNLEQSQTPAKRMKMQFILFMALAISFGSNPKYIHVFYFFWIGFLLLEGIKTYLLYREEKKQVKKGL